jgi:hypothetical protein
MARLFRHSVLLVALLGLLFATASPRPISAADPAPYYENLTQSCTTTNYVKPCHNRDSDDAYFVYMAECSSQITTFCYTATKSDGTALPSTVKFVAGVSAYKVHTPSVDIAGYESFANAYYVPPTGGATIGNDYFGSSDRPVDQPGNQGKLDLSPALSASDSIKLVLKYKTTAIPQYSVLIADGGTMDFSMTGQDVTVTMEGKPARLAIESAAQHINFDTEKSDDTTKPWTDRCGIPSMQFVVCNVDTAASDALAFYARTKTFVNGSAAESPAPIWVSTNATYFHFPNIKIDTVAKTKRLEVKTAAPHLLANGSTLHTGNFTAFLPNGVLSDWKVQKTEESLKRLLAVTIEKAGQDTTVTPTFTISDTGVKVDFPRISYSSPVMKVGTVAETTATTVPAASSTTTTTTTAATSTKTIAKKKTVALTSLIKLVGKGAATWRVTGGCKIAGKSLVTPAKAAVCALTLRQAASGKTKASTRTLRIKVA